MLKKPTYEELEQRIKELERESLEPKKISSEITTGKYFYETILDGIINGVWVTDKDDVIYYTNKSMGIIAGMPQEQIVGTRVLEYFPESTLKIFRPYYLKAKETQQPVYYNAVPVRTSAGLLSYLSGWLIPRIEGDTIDGMICTVEDTTERKNAEDALQKVHDELLKNVEERTAKLVEANEQLKREIEEHKLSEEEASYEQNLMQSLFNNIPGYIYFKDRNRRFVHASNYFCDLFKRSIEDIIGKTDEDLFPEEIAKETASDDRYVIETGIPLIDKEEGGESIGGEEHWVLTTKLPWRDKEGNIIGLFGISREITDRKQAEEALRKAHDQLENRVEDRTAKLSEANLLLNQEFAERIRVENALRKSEKRYRIVSELTTDFAYAFRVENEETLSLEWVTEAIHHITGFTLDELRSRGGWQSIVHPNDARIVEDQLKALLRGQSKMVQYRILTAKGDVRWLSDSGRPEWNQKQDGVTYIYGAVQNITEQKRAENDLKESEQKYRLLVENANEGIVVGQDGLMKFANSKIQNILGYSEEELSSQPFMDFVHPEDRKKVTKHHLYKLENPEKQETYDLRIIDKGGNVRWVENNGVGINWKTKPATLNFLSDITDRMRAEERLKQNEAMLWAIFDGILDPLILVGKNMEARMLNQAAAEYYGITDPQKAIGKLCYQVLKGRFEPCEGCEAPSVSANGQYISYERKGLMDSDRFESVVIYPLKETGGKVGDVIVRVSDITEKRLFERQLIQKEKLSSLGVLVSSIAHEINNPNNFVSFNIPILRDYIEEMIPIIDEYAVEHPEFELCNLTYPEFRQDIFKLIVNIENGSRRISTFVSNLRRFSQTNYKTSLIWIDLKDVIESVHSICHSKIKSSVKSFVKNIPEDLPKIYTEPYALEQILLNLLMNAAQASDKHDSWIKLNVTVNNGEQEHITIEVSDNGCGIDKEAQLRMFDPFFTTKSQAEGTGLGLYVCHTLVERLKGCIEVESEPGEGSIFRVMLSDKDRTRKKDYS